ncbi:hypothetical protein ABRP17_011125 [Stenotrophomonas sp. WHRI 8082]|uniref:hypothetical protein n=1 Tax=Stenotrophomonas sp. WHRI 8082 TaxID=3162571 RepID=UPI0032EDCD31
MRFKAASPAPAVGREGDGSGAVGGAVSCLGGTGAATAAAAATATATTLRLKLAAGGGAAVVRAVREKLHNDVRAAAALNCPLRSASPVKAQRAALTLAGGRMDAPASARVAAWDATAKAGFGKRSAAPDRRFITACVSGW